MLYVMPLSGFFKCVRVLSVGSRFFFLAENKQINQERVIPGILCTFVYQ